MKKPVEEVVMYDAPEAATYRTDIHGWVSRDGIFFGGSESAARYRSCTHRPCTRCGKPARKMYSACDGCREAAAAARYQSMPRAKWDGEAMLYADARDEYYTDLDHAEDDLGEGETLADLRLVICEPVYVRQLDPGDWADAMPDDTDLPDEVHEAIGAFNEAVAGILISWRPGTYALDLSDGGDDQ